MDDNDSLSVGVQKSGGLLQTNDSLSQRPAHTPQSLLAGKRTGMVVFSQYPSDPRPRRAADALLKEQMYVDLICEGDEKSPKREKLGNLEVIRLPIRHRRGGAISYAYQYASFLFLSAGILAWRTLRHRYDLVYVHNMPDILVMCALVPRLLGAKVILDQHDPMPELLQTIFAKDQGSFAVRVLRCLEKLSLAYADLVITVNLACKRIFSTRSCRADKIGIVMNTPDEEIFPYRPAGSYRTRGAGDPFVMMYHGSLVDRNGLELAVDAVAELIQTVPEAELRVYGRNTKYLERVLAKARCLGIEERVCYLGPKTLEELVREIETCDVGVIPNPKNTFTEINTPTRIFEYLVLGRPVVAPRTTGIQDYFHSDALLFFEPADAKDLARTLAYAALHPEEVSALAERGQQVYLMHRWRDERKKLIDLVCSVLEKPHRAAIPA